MYLLLINRYNSESGTHYYEVYESINNEEVANYIAHKFIKNSDFCMIRVGFLTQEYQDTVFGEFDSELKIA